MKALIGILAIFSLSNVVLSQNYNDSTIVIRGRVIDSIYNVRSFNTVILNKSTGKGSFGNYDGSFEIRVKKSDRIGIAVHGYKTINISYKDSVYRPFYRSTFYIQELSYEGQEVIVRPLKTLEELKEERASLEKRPVPELSPVSAISSPITALYVAFSKREKTKRMVAEMEYKDKQEDVIREILRVYVHNDIFDLSDEDFDEFIHFLNLDIHFLMNANDIDLAVYIRNKFFQFQEIKRGY